MTELGDSVNPVDIAEEIKRLRVDLAHARTTVEREAISRKMFDLTMHKVAINRNLDRMQRQMHDIAEYAEKSGVGTGGKGSPPEE